MHKVDLDQEFFKIIDKQGFCYLITIKYYPHFGFANGHYQETIIGQVELNKIHQPLSDDDSEWEMYEELYEEWKCEIKMNMEFIGKDYFNQVKK